jgi:ADP-ribose pyrophosphatase
MSSRFEYQVCLKCEVANSLRLYYIKYQDEIKTHMKVIKTDLLKETKWMQMHEKTYRDTTGQLHTWHYVERRNKTEAAVIIPVDLSKKRILLIKQYRVVLEKYVIEFPAGLIDFGETVAQAACRELSEETGFEGRLLSISPQLCTSPGMTNEIIYMVQIAVDLSDGQVQEKLKQQKLESTEEIEVLVLELNQYNRRLQEFAEQGLIIDSKVWVYGMSL